MIYNFAARRQMNTKITGGTIELPTAVPIINATFVVESAPNSGPAECLLPF
jgi:hypothetical protein